MPNWCENKLTVTNSTPELEAFLQEHGLSFGAIVKPNIPEYDENNFGTIEAQVTAWGTKWDLADDEQKEAAASLLEWGDCRFDTAWSPPLEAISALSELTGASFRLAYSEQGCAFYGIAEFADGSCSDACSSIEDSQEYAKFLVEYMDYPEDDAAEASGWELAEE